MVGVVIEFVVSMRPSRFIIVGDSEGANEGECVGVSLGSVVGVSVGGSVGD